MYFLPGLGVSAIKHFDDFGAMAMKREFMLKLNTVHVGQLLDGLRMRAKSWRNTEAYMRDGYQPDESLSLEECTSEYEAEQLAELYESIIATIEEQVADQGGWSGKGANE